MFGKSIFSRARALATQFAHNDRGNIAVIFAIAIIPVLGFVGAAVDYTRMNAARSSMQAALDSASLMVSKDVAASPTMTTSQITTAAQNYFSALYHNKDAQSVTIGALYTASTANVPATVKVSGSGNVQTDFMKLMGFQTLGFNSDSTATWGSSRLRVALVLDVTGSMGSDSKMPNLQTSANAMIDTLSALSKTPGDILISITPFAKDVNVGLAAATPTWTTGWPAWKDEPAAIKLAQNKPAHWTNYGPGANCPFVISSQSFNCASTPVNGSDEVATVPTTGTYTGLICPGLDSGTSNYYNGCYTSVWDGQPAAAVTLCTGTSNSGCTCNAKAIGGAGSNACTCNGTGATRTCTQNLRTYSHVWTNQPPPAYGGTQWNPQTTWNGCVTDRDQSYDVANTAPIAGDINNPNTQFYVEQWSTCPSVAIVPMTGTWSTLKTAINNLTPNGNTNQAIGLAWGWLTLGQNIPELKAPVKDPAYSYKDYIVLVSDGLNTQDRWYTDAASIDARQAILCKAVKDAGITIFTLQINTGTGRNADPESAILKSCASDGNFQMITAASQTANAFKNITTQLSQLRIAK